MDHIIVNKADKKNIKSINSMTIKTLGYNVIPIQINDVTSLLNSTL